MDHPCGIWGPTRTTQALLIVRPIGWKAMNDTFIKHADNKGNSIRLRRKRVLTSVETQRTARDRAYLEYRRATENPFLDQEMVHKPPVLGNNLKMHITLD